MKYLKSYETEQEQVYKYNKGDYILLDLDQIKIGNDYEDWCYELSDLGIIKDQVIGTIGPLDYKYDHISNYDVEFPNNDTWYIRENEILRKLTPNEIKEFEFRKDIKNFNL